LLRVPLAGRFLRWRHSRATAQLLLLIPAAALIAQGLFGPSLAPKNLAAVLTWIHFRGALILILLAAGNFFCFACPFVFARNAARRIFTPRFNWPERLRNKWPAVGLFVLFLFCYELFDLWSSPWWTAAVAATYFVLILLVDGLFKHAAFCKFVCPIGQFNFLASMLSPLEVKVRDHGLCARCATKDCIRGRRAQPPAPSSGNALVILQRGCELALFQPRKVGNMDCTFCMDCVHACPHDNIGVTSRPVASELLVDPLRSGIGRLSRRKDILALVIAFCFGALLNAFGMVSPVYEVEAWLGKALGVRHEAPVLALLFFAFLVVAPAMLIAAAKFLARPTPAARYVYALVPLGFGMWLAHYGFHFLTGILTIVPVAQNALRSIGVEFLGAPRWTWTGLPVRFVRPIELTFLVLGLAGALFVAFHLAEEDNHARTTRTFLPWAAVCLLIAAASVWLMFLPMEMRATLMGG